MIYAKRDTGLSAFPTTMHATAFLMNNGENTVYGSVLPAMSQSYTLILVPLTLIIFSTKSIMEPLFFERFLVKILCAEFSSFNYSQLKKAVMTDDFPTRGSPTTRIL
jgi:hypothetical protein